jgi:predicted ribosomally synthesized peptide with SipW-like signal peptide
MRKLLISILSVALGAALIYGATMAWFTDGEKSLPNLQAGTVDIIVGITIIEGRQQLISKSR